MNVKSWKIINLLPLHPKNNKEIIPAAPVFAKDKEQNERIDRQKQKRHEVIGVLANKNIGFGNI